MWEGSPPCSGCNSTHVAKSRRKWRDRGRRAERRTGKKSSSVMYERRGRDAPPIEFEDEAHMNHLSHHPEVPEDCPGMASSEGRWFFEVSWADEELALDEAYQYQDVYLIVGSLCFFIATEQGNTALAQQWADWIAECGSEADEKDVFADEADGKNVPEADEEDVFSD